MSPFVRTIGVNKGITLLGVIPPLNATLQVLYQFSLIILVCENSLSSLTLFADAKPTKITGVAFEPILEKKDVASKGESQDQLKKEKKSKKIPGPSKKRAASDIEGKVPTSKKRTVSNTGAEVSLPKAKKLKEAKKGRLIRKNIPFLLLNLIPSKPKVVRLPSPRRVSILSKLPRASKLPKLRILTYLKQRRKKINPGQLLACFLESRCSCNCLSASFSSFNRLHSGGASGNLGSASTTAAMSSSVANLDSIINFPQIDQEGFYIVPTPKSGDLIFNEDDFDLISILSEAKEAFSLELPKDFVKTEKTDIDAQGAESGREDASFQFDQQPGEDQAMPDLTHNEVDSSLIVANQAARIHECLNRPLSDLLTDENLKSILVEDSAILAQHKMEHAEALQRFLEDLYECERYNSREASNKEIWDQDTILAKCQASIDQVTPILNTGKSKEEEAIRVEHALLEEIQSLEKRLADARSSLLSTKEGLLRIKSSNAKLKASLSNFETKQTSAKTSKATALRTLEEADREQKEADD
ncbi:hypothetical protein PIB30_008354 [Stylosanthes scabra]|uniref:Uncharacterized protein n=1 Tax=Stylosanthes scabra TaxID=79078 RepID=A0ABU6T5E1_9FABA|nr:hypothetical protein [Stylosanthes scabra]